MMQDSKKKPLRLHFLKGSLSEVDLQDYLSPSTDGIMQAELETDGTLTLISPALDPHMINAVIHEVACVVGDPRIFVVERRDAEDAVTVDLDIAHPCVQ